MIKRALVALGLLFGLIVVSTAQWNGCTAGFCNIKGSISSSPIAFIDGIATASSNSTSVTSAAINSTGANFLVACVANYGGAAAGSVTDSKSNAWTPLTRFIDGGNLSSIFCAWSKPSSVGSGHTAMNTSTQPSIGFAAFSNVNATPPDGEVGTSGSSTAPAGGSITPSANGGLIISAFGGLTTAPITIDSSFAYVGTIPSDTCSAQCFALGMAYLIQTSVAAVNPTWTTGSNNPWGATNNAYKN